MKLDYRLPSTLEGKRHIMGILMNKMYLDPVTACVREIISNAVDANRAAERTGVEIIVTQDGCSIKDNGGGISEECMSKVFTEFGVSTKQDDEESIGAFGIGATSIFAIGGATIVTNNGGRCRSYEAFLEDGLPVIELKEDSESFEQGTTFHLKFEKNLPWNVLLADIPDATVNGNKVQRPEIFGGPNWSLRGSANGKGIERLLVSVKGVSYLVNRNCIGSEPFNPLWYSRNSKSKLELLIRLNDVELSATREAINEEKEGKRIDELVEEIGKSLEAEFHETMKRVSNVFDAIESAEKFQFLKEEPYFHNRNLRKLGHQLLVNTVGFWPDDSLPSSKLGQRHVYMDYHQVKQYPLYYNWQNLNINQIRTLVDDPQFIFVDDNQLFDAPRLPEYQFKKKEVQNPTWRGRVKVFEGGEWKRASTIEKGYYVEEPINYSSIKKLFEIEKLYCTSSENVRLFDLPFEPLRNKLEKKRQEGFERFGLLGVAYLNNYRGLDSEFQKWRDTIYRMGEVLKIKENIPHLSNGPSQIEYVQEMCGDLSKEGSIEKFLKTEAPVFWKWLTLRFQEATAPLSDTSLNDVLKSARLLNLRVGPGSTDTVSE